MLCDTSEGRSDGSWGTAMSKVRGEELAACGGLCRSERTEMSDFSVDDERGQPVDLR